MESPTIISMEFSTAGKDDCYYRILAGSSVKYITIQAGALSADLLMDMPLDFQNILPSLPYYGDDWNQAYISRNPASGKLEAMRSQKELPGVQTIWHSEMISFLDLERTQQLGLLAQECVWKQGLSESHDQPGTRGRRMMIAKVARFPWEIQYVEMETQVYQLLQPLGITPKFLGHVHEAGRVIGLLLEKVEARPANWGDLEICQVALRRLHDLGIVHGDCNRYNFIIGSEDTVTLIDFDNAKIHADAKMMEMELASLEQQLREDSDRGGGFVIVESG